MKVSQNETKAGREVVRDDQWRAAFGHQATATLRRRALNVARGCVRMIEMSGGQVSSSHAEDLVDDAIADTWLGRLSWDPSRRDLLSHVASTIESRARHERKKAEKFPAASLDAADDDDDDDRAAALWTEAEEVLAASASVGNIGELVCVIDVFERVRALAAGDLEVLTLLDAMEAGAVERADLIQATGMSARRYESVRRRLDTLVRKLPPDVLQFINAARPAVSEPRAA